MRSSSAAPLFSPFALCYLLWYPVLLCTAQKTRPLGPPADFGNQGVSTKFRRRDGETNSTRRPAAASCAHARNPRVASALERRCDWTGVVELPAKHGLRGAGRHGPRTIRPEVPPDEIRWIAHLGTTKPVRRRYVEPDRPLSCGIDVPVVIREAVGVRAAEAADTAQYLVSRYGARCVRSGDRARVEGRKPARRAIDRDLRYGPRGVGLDDRGVPPRLKSYGGVSVRLSGN